MNFLNIWKIQNNNLEGKNQETIIIIAHLCLNAFFFFLEVLKTFIHKELVLFPPKVDVMDEPSKEVQLGQLNEADVLCILVETLAAHIEAVFPDQTVAVWADPARARTLAEFSRMAPVELLVTHVAFSAAMR